MPPVAKHDIAIVLYDLNVQPNFVTVARDCLYEICANKLFFNSNDTAKIILLNTAETSNSLHGQHGGFKHIYEATDEIFYDPHLIKKCIESDMETASGNWLNGLAVATDILKNQFLNRKGVISLQILLVTDLSTQIQNLDEEDVCNRIKELKMLGAYLYILGPHVKIPFTLSSRQDIEKWKTNVEYIDSEKSNPNLSIAKSIIQNTNGIICDTKIGIQLFNCYKNNRGLQPWCVPMTFGTVLEVNASTSRFLRKPAPAKITEAIKRTKTWKWADAGDLTKEVAFENVIGGVALHKKFIPLPNDVTQKFKYLGPRCFKVLGFTESRNIPEYFMRGDGARTVMSDEKKPESRKCLVTLIKTLSELNMYAVARQVYMKNCKPKLAVLIPNPEDQCFIMVQLLYGDDLKTDYQENDPTKIKPEGCDLKLKEETYNFLDQLDVSTHQHKDSNSSTLLPLGINFMNDINCHILAQNALQKYFDETCTDFDERDIEVLNLNFVNTSKIQGLLKLWPSQKEIPAADSKQKEVSGTKDGGTGDPFNMNTDTDQSDEEFPF